MNAVKGRGVDLEYDFTGLHNFVKAITTSENLVVKVGIFGNKNAREKVSDEQTGKSTIRKTVKGSKATLTNAELGLVHELGSVERGIPKRSFLRMPISVKSKEILKGAMVGAVELMVKGNVKKVLDNLGKQCEKWIQIAFATRGFGNWAPDQAQTARRKGSNQPLIDTHQLRNSIVSKVGAK